MKLAVHTIPGTGTRFLEDILLKVLGYERTGVTRFQQAGDGALVYISKHIQPHGYESDGIKGLPAHLPLVSSLRHPHLSFLTRHRASQGKETVEDHASRWARLMEVAARRPVHLFPVAEGDDQTERVQRLMWAIGVEDYDTPAMCRLLRYWTPVGSQGPALTSQGEMDLSSLDDAVQWFQENT